jgi:hypothetical protein
MQQQAPSSPSCWDGVLVVQQYIDGPGRDIRIDGNLCQRWALSLAIKRLIDSQLGIGRRRKKITFYRLGCTLCM